VREAHGFKARIGVYANAFPPQSDEAANEGLSDIRADLTPTRYAQFAKAWVRHGADIIGGCCGIGPEHIAALKPLRGPEKIARFDSKKLSALMVDAGIVRNRLKIESAVKNARAFLEVQKEFGSFDAYVWPFVGGKPIVNRRRGMKDIPPTSRESDALSKDLKKRGFNFVGSTIVYAHMQAVGMVNDHVVSCFRYRPCARLR